MNLGADRNDQLDALEIATFVTGRWHENAYVVTDRNSGEAALIDPGDDAERIIRYLDQARVVPKLILITHAHFDHVGAAEALSSWAGISCAVHSSDVALLKRAPLYALSFEGRRSFTVPRQVAPFEDGATFAFGKVSVQVQRLPGHTSGSVCLRCGPALFSGDTLLNKKRGRTDLPGGDPEALERSIAALMEGLDDVGGIFPGHGHRFSPDDARAWWAAEQKR
jgi:hydroxyacylglutathione hydrolase